jgi:hypothetical protein
MGEKCSGVVDLLIRLTAARVGGVRDFRQQAVMPRRRYRAVAITLHHAPEPIQMQKGGSTLAAEWMPHCSCSWRDPDHLCSERLEALSRSMDHIARCPESWGEAPVSA